ncbi:MAG: VCBS repeat-containing protein [Pseudomonadota bacterium]
MTGVPRRRLLLVAVALAIVALGIVATKNRDALIPAARLSTDHTIVVETIEMGDRFVWGITIADFDGDGDDDFLVAGHGGRDHDRIFYYDGSGYLPGKFSFPRTADRHGCAAADVNEDGALDVYCTSGAERGVGSNANELFLGHAGQQVFRRVNSHFGAEDPYGRGRYTTFLSIDGTRSNDLFATVWGPRNDDKPNESSLYRNTDGAFKRFDSRASGRWGGRCLIALDMDEDGASELAVCHDAVGASFLANNGRGNFEAHTLPAKDAWWLALAPFPNADTPPVSFGALVLDDKGGSLQQYLGSPAELTRRWPLRLLPGARARRCIPTSLALGVPKNMTEPAALISRVQFDDKHYACREGDDLVLLGPDLSEFLPVPPSPWKTKAQVYALNGHFLRLTAGESWSGGLELLRVVPVAQ